MGTNQTNPSLQPVLVYGAMIVAVVLTACGWRSPAETVLDDLDLGGTDVATDGDVGDDGGAAIDGGTAEDTAPAPAGIGSCHYVNTFSQNTECKLYTGSAWTEESASADCAEGPFGDAGEWALIDPDSTNGGLCQIEAQIGFCDVPSEEGLEYLLYVGGTAENCDAAETACTTFIGGSFEADEACGS